LNDKEYLNLDRFILFCYRYFIIYFFIFQTIIHWTALMLSILFYFAFILIYNSFCITCFGLQNPYWVLHHSMGTAEFWLVILVSCVLALLPRYVCLIYLLFKLGYNYLNFMLHKPEKFVKIKSLWSSLACPEDQMSYSLMNIRQIHVFFN
jgi:hypothetical protein